MMLGASTANAVVNPESEKAGTPVVLKCRVERVSTEPQGELTVYSAYCRVMEVTRSPSRIEPGDLIHIYYGVNQAEIDRQAREMQENPMPGPAPASAPRPLEDGEVIIAYLKEVRGADGNRSYLPNIGFQSFERVAAPSAVTHCEEGGEAAVIMANAKVCAEEKLLESEQALTLYMAEQMSRIESQLGDPDTELAFKGRAESLNASHAAWHKYRDETCRYAYFQYFPGSMARLEELTCQRELTNKRLVQLELISSLAGTPIDY